MKILVDTSVWVDFFNGVASSPRFALRKLIEMEEEIFISGYILAETLQGFKDDREFEWAKSHLLKVPILDMPLPEAYIEASQIYRNCRKKGLTIRKTADCLIAQTALTHDAFLLHNDKDFDRIAMVCNLHIFPVKRIH